MLRAQVSPVGKGPGEARAAHLAHVGLFARVGHDVAAEVARVQDELAAHGTALLEQHMVPELRLLAILRGPQVNRPHRIGTSAGLQCQRKRGLPCSCAIAVRGVGWIWGVH